MSEEDRKSWLEIMEGKEPVYSSLKVIECKYLNPVFASVIIFMVHVYLPPPPSLSLCVPQWLLSMSKDMNLSNGVLTNLKLEVCAVFINIFFLES